jgi:hypothetical protein
VTEKYDKLIAGGLTVEKRWGKPEDVGRAAAILSSTPLISRLHQVPAKRLSTKGHEGTRRETKRKQKERRSMSRRRSRLVARGTGFQSVK